MVIGNPPWSRRQKNQITTRSLRIVYKMCALANVDGRIVRIEVESPGIVVSVSKEVGASFDLGA